MWVEAILLEDDLAALLTQFAPVTIRLGEDGELHVSEPTDIALVAEVGLRVVCKARLRWSVLGISVPINIQSLTVVIRPEIAKAPAGDQVVFKLEIEHMDLSGFPALLDAGIADIVNRELAARHVELAWSYAETLTHAFDLPEILQPLERLELAVTGARVKATSKALGLAIEFRANVNRADGRNPPPVRKALRATEAPAPAPARPQTGRPWLRGLIATAAGAALWGAYALGRGRRAHRRLSWR